MPASEFVDWIAYSRIEPFGDERADWHAAIQAMVVAETQRGKTTRKKPYQVSDFLLNFEKAQPKSWQSQLQFVEMLNAAYGGKDERTPTPDSDVVSAD